MKPIRLRKKGDLVGIKVETSVRLHNGFMEIPKGTICTVTDSFKGYSLTSAPCPTCGVRVSIGNVPRHELRPRFDLTDLEEANRVRKSSWRKSIEPFEEGMV